MNLLLHPDPAIRQALLDALGVATCIIEFKDGNFVIAAMNDLCRVFYGFHPATLQVPLTVDAISLATGAAKEQAAAGIERTIVNYRHCLETRQAISHENTITLSDGRLHSSRRIVSPILRGEEVVCLLVTVLDITEMMEAQLELEKNLTRLLGQHIDVCRICKRVKGASNDWQTIEAFMEKRNDLVFSHGICDDCERENS